MIKRWPFCARDGEWFDYFYEQFLLAWDEAESNAEG
jgi:hypothetical protein